MAVNHSWALWPVSRPQRGFNLGPAHHQLSLSSSYNFHCNHHHHHHDYLRIISIIYLIRCLYQTRTWGAHSIHFLIPLFLGEVSSPGRGEGGEKMQNCALPIIPYYFQGAILRWWWQRHSVCTAWLRSTPSWRDASSISIQCKTRHIFQARSRFPSTHLWTAFITYPKILQSPEITM